MTSGCSPGRVSIRCYLVLQRRVRTPCIAAPHPTCSSAKCAGDIAFHRREEQNLVIDLLQEIQTIIQREAAMLTVAAIGISNEVSGARFSSPPTPVTMPRAKSGTG